MSLSSAEREALITAIRRRPRAAEGGACHGARAKLSSGVPKPGEWSAHEVVVHCADSETNAAARIRYLAAEADPVILGYDEAEWARRFDYHHHPLEPALALVEAVRANTTALIRRMPEDAWERVGRHTESGRYAAEDWLKIYAEHLEIHARQIEANVAAWRAAKGAAT